MIKLLASDDDDVVAIAIFDVGEFVRHYPNGRSIAKRLGAKDLVMRLIEHENPEVQRHALVCVSKMLVHNWRVRKIKASEVLFVAHVILRYGTICVPNHLSVLVTSFLIEDGKIVPLEHKCYVAS